LEKTLVAGFLGLASVFSPIAVSAVEAGGNQPPTITLPGVEIVQKTGGLNGSKCDPRKNPDTSTKTVGVVRLTKDTTAVLKRRIVYKYTCTNGPVNQRWTHPCRCNPYQGKWEALWGTGK